MKAKGEKTMCQILKMIMSNLSQEERIGLLQQLYLRPADSLPQGALRLDFGISMTK